MQGRLQSCISLQMKLRIVSWNVKGANDSDKRNAIKYLIRTQKADLIYLQETKILKMLRELVRSLRVGDFWNGELWVQREPLVGCQCSEVIRC